MSDRISASLLLIFAVPVSFFGESVVEVLPGLWMNEGISIL